MLSTIANTTNGKPVKSPLDHPPILEHECGKPLMISDFFVAVVRIKMVKFGESLVVLGSSHQYPNLHLVTIGYAQLIPVVYQIMFHFPKTRQPNAHEPRAARCTLFTALGKSTCTDTSTCFHTALRCEHRQRHSEVTVESDPRNVYGYFMYSYDLYIRMYHVLSHLPKMLFFQHPYWHGLLRPNEMPQVHHPIMSHVNHPVIIGARCCTTI